MEDKESKWFSLSVILQRVKSIFDESISAIPFWMKTEIAQINKDRNGNYYLEIVESKGDTILAKARATIWNKAGQHIHAKLGAEAPNILKEGAEILCYCNLVFHPIYGLSVNISDIDLQFSLGEVEKRKQETIARLKQEGLLELNRSKDLPLIGQRIALISSEETAGHVDFVNHLTNNSYDYIFHIDHYNCRVQGEYAVSEIILQLQKIPASQYDVIVLIRGGGATLDLDIFNDYLLAKEIATMHTPVLTGIGHETDTTVADFVAHTRFKTPSAVAAFLIEKAHKFEITITQNMRAIQERAKHLMMIENHYIDAKSKSFRLVTSKLLQSKNEELNAIANKVSYLSKHFMHQQHSQLKSIQDILKLASIQKLNREKVEIVDVSKTIAYITNQRYIYEKQKIATQEEELKLLIRNKFKREFIKIEQLENVQSFYNFDSLLKRGFAIVRHNKKTIQNSTHIEVGDNLEIETFEKLLTVTISDIKETIKWKNLPTKKQQKN